ncbi:MAG: Asp-tRNA(Asn)/Glu-tRNA(Gln) amidotransferase subunit GatC [Peptococcales bacterium]|jgi:aspartyl-tRNA(Asn)/glutamyl-tRNA(Gln) amidotransferase subunit C
MNLTLQDLEEIALTARLELTDEEKNEQLTKLNKALEDVKVLKQADIEKIEPLAYVLPITNVLREDELRESLSQEKALQNAPEQEDGMFRVPKII